ncbi:hypothetical protein PoB_006748000 [Plakobranchus ocellatus]|uniref:HTH psq-type domain-containing protein n=1 Tax=Plakobranchus ocellatus TaxID=259542 RepID=A0AAV4DA59_9GAST|nr:hypothetical protein PoB_006748000 [Plakobranchus ocellatus]
MESDEKWVPPRKRRDESGSDSDDNGIDFQPIGLCGTFESDDMKAAVLAVMEYKQSIRKVAKDFSFKRTTLTRSRGSMLQEPTCYEASVWTRR